MRKNKGGGMIHIDLETKSEIDLKKAGPWRYSQGEAADIIVMYYSVDGADPVKWEPGDPVPPEFETAEGYIARNATFEYALVKNVLVEKYGFPARMMDVTLWHCTRAASLCAGLPGSLAKSAAVLKVPQQKQTEGAGLIQKYSVPVIDKKSGALFGTPEKYHFRELKGADKKLFFDYCRADVIADMQVYNKIKGLSNNGLERSIFLIDFFQNVRGLRVDVAAMKKFIKCYAAIEKRAEEDAEKYGVNPRSPKGLIEWMQAKFFPIEDARAGTIEKALKKAKKEGKRDIQTVLELRQFLSKSSVKKYHALAERVCRDGCVRDFLRYYGAHTGRWSGAGFQPHNLPKTGTTADEIDEAINALSPDMSYTDIIDAGQCILPGLIIPDEGRTFLLGDFSAIEARGIAYLAGQDDLLNDFKNNIDVYIKMGARITGTPEKLIDKAHRARKIGKVGILSCGYGAGTKGITGMLEGYGLTADEGTAEQIVNTYRDTYKKIVSYWYDLERAFTKAIRNKKKYIDVGIIKMCGVNRFVQVTLPSGRVLYYHEAQAEECGASYWNYSQDRRVQIWGGLLAENITQAMCRDILANRMLACIDARLLPVLHVHDEIICEVPLDTAEADAEKFLKVMNTPPEWLPGFPLKTEIEISRRYHK